MNIPLKINKENRSDRVPPPHPAAPEKAVKARRFKPVWLLILGIMVILASAGVFMFVKSRPFSPYQPLIPQEAVGVFYFDQNRLAQVISQLRERDFNWYPFVSAQSGIAGFFAKNNANPAQIGGLLDEKIALALLPCSDSPEKNADRPSWLFLAKIKDQPGLIILADQAENQFKRNYNVASENYRQVRIIEVKALNQSQSGAFYARIQGYLLISSDREVLRGVIDKIIGT